MTKLAARTGQIDSSGIRKVFNLAAQMENPINLSIGQPHFEAYADVEESGSFRAEGIPPGRWTVDAEAWNRDRTVKFVAKGTVESGSAVEIELKQE